MSGVLLETCFVGGREFTSQEALDRFDAAVTEARRNGVPACSKKSKKPNQACATYSQEAAVSEGRLMTSGEKLLADLGSIGWQPDLTSEWLEKIATAGFRGENQVNAAMVVELAATYEPITLHGLFYRCVSAGIWPSTDARHYNAIKRLTAALRKKRLLPYEWIVDSLRSTLKPSSWSGLNDYAETVSNSYRKDFWANLDWFVHIFSEKDAIAGTIQPVTEEYDVALTPIRGNVSLSMVYRLGRQFADIDKPIACFYVGDFDPNGMDIERDLKQKLEEHSGRVLVNSVSEFGESINHLFRERAKQSGNRAIYWQRLAITADDIEAFDLLPLEAKKTDTRYRKFVEEHGTQCAEVDALPPTELRERVESAIEPFIPAEEWEKLKRTEELERETRQKSLLKFGAR